MKKKLFILLILNFEKIFSFEPSSASVFAKASTDTSSSSSSNSLSSLSSSSSEMDAYEKYKKDWELKKEEREKYLLEKATRDPLSIINEYLPKCVSHEQWNENCKKLIDAVKQGNIQEVRELLESGEVDVNHKDNYYANTVLILASYYGRVEAVKLLLENKADVNTKNDIRSTALICASCNNLIEITKILLAHKADVNAKNDYEDTALKFALKKNGNQEIAKLLKEHGAIK